MKISLLAGITPDADRQLYMSLTKNRQHAHNEGCVVPAPRRFRRDISLLMRDDADGNTPEVSEKFAVHGINDAISRSIVWAGGILGNTFDPEFPGAIYPFAVERISQIMKLFPDAEFEIFWGVQNLISEILDAMSAANTSDPFGLLNGADPRDLAWSTLFLRLREAFPAVKHCFWCEEDSPLIWPQLIREIAGFTEGTAIEGGEDRLATIMTEEGFERFNAYVSQHPGMTEMHKRRVMAVFLDKFLKKELVEQELDVPGWTQDFVEEMQDNYDEDIDYIRRIPGVNFIAP